MQRNKGIHSLSHIGNIDTNNLTITELFSKTLASLDLSYINKLLNGAKSKGVPAQDIFKTIFLLSFLDFGNVYQLVRSGLGAHYQMTKDMYYQFMKNANVDWRTIVWLFIKRIISVIESKGNSLDCESPKCFIVDDTIIPKKGKTIEFIGKVYNHVTMKYELGMKVLTLGYWDGKTFLPIDFSLHYELGKKGHRGMNTKELKQQYTKNRDESCLSTARVSQLSVDKLTIALLMIKQYASRIRGVQYVLADSWFISEVFIRTILNLKQGINVIGLMKSNRNVVINEESILAKNVPSRFKKDISRSNKYNCEYISKVIVYKDIEVNGYWIKMRGQQNWHLLICTDKKLKFTLAMQYYQIRWSIEVFFKDCKQKLRLNTCQSTDFDAHIAHTSIVFLNYATLALRQRFDAHETLGQLFRHVKSILLEATIVNKIWAIFCEIYAIVLAPLGTEWELFIQSVIENKNKIDDILQKIFSSLSYAYVDTRDF